MTPVTAPTTAAPPDDPVRAALADPATGPALMAQAMSRLNRWLADLPRSRREQEAREVVDLTTARAWEVRATFDPAVGGAGAWLHGVLVRVLSEHCRKLRKLPAQPPADLDGRAARPDFGTDPGSDVIARLDRLRPDERALVEWAVFDDLSHRQIADRLKIREGTARVRLHRVLTKLEHSIRAERREGRS